MEDMDKMGADSLAENTVNAIEFIRPICLPKPKSSGCQWKKASLGVRSPRSSIYSSQNVAPEMSRMLGKCFLIGSISKIFAFLNSTHMYFFLKFIFVMLLIQTNNCVALVIEELINHPLKLQTTKREGKLAKLQRGGIFSSSIYLSETLN